MLGRLRLDGSLPAAWVEAYPVQARLAARMVAHDPTARPSCGEILGELLEEGLWVRPTPAAVESVVCHLQKEVAGLKVRLQTRDAEVAALRSLLDSSGIPHDHIPTDTHSWPRVQCR